jgi:hypothetical protein
MRGGALEKGVDRVVMVLMLSLLLLMMAMIPAADEADHDATPPHQIDSGGDEELGPDATDNAATPPGLPSSGESSSSTGAPPGLRGMMGMMGSMMPCAEGHPHTMAGGAPPLPGPIPGAPINTILKKAFTGFHNSHKFGHDNASAYLGDDLSVHRQSFFASPMLTPQGLRMRLSPSAARPQQTPPPPPPHKAR